MFKIGSKLVKTLINGRSSEMWDVIYWGTFGRRQKSCDLLWWGLACFILWWVQIFIPCNGGTVVNCIKVFSRWNEQRECTRYLHSRAQTWGSINKPIPSGGRSTRVFYLSKSSKKDVVCDCETTICKVTSNLQYFPLRCVRTTLHIHFPHSFLLSLTGFFTTH